MVIDVYEGRDFGSFGIPGAYFRSDFPEDKHILMKLRGSFVDIMRDVNPEYIKNVVYDKEEMCYLLHFTLNTTPPPSRVSSPNRADAVAIASSGK